MTNSRQSGTDYTFTAVTVCVFFFNISEAKLNSKYFLLQWPDAYWVELGPLAAVCVDAATYRTRLRLSPGVCVSRHVATPLFVRLFVQVFVVLFIVSPLLSVWAALCQRGGGCL